MKVSTREAIGDLLNMENSNSIDLIIPRGSGELVKSIKQKSKMIPVLGHADGDDAGATAAPVTGAVRPPALPASLGLPSLTASISAPLLVTSPLGSKLVLAMPRFPVSSSNGVPLLVVLQGGCVVCPRFRFNIRLPTGVFGQRRIKNMMKKGDEIAIKMETLMPAAMLNLNAKTTAEVSAATAITPSKPPVGKRNSPTRRM